MSDRQEIDNSDEHRYEGMEDWPTTAHTCRERLLEENAALRTELADRERPCRYSPDFSPIERTHAFIQWKGTDVCLDFRCDCGAQGHFDGMFAYALTCGDCHKTFQLPHTVALIEQDPVLDKWHEGKLVEMKVW